MKAPWQRVTRVSARRGTGLRKGPLLAREPGEGGVSRTPWLCKGERMEK